VSCSVKQLKYELSHDGNMDEIKGSFDQWTRRRGFPRPVQHPASLAHSPWACSVEGGGGWGGGGGAPPPPRPPPPRSFSSESQRGWQYGVQRPAQGPHGMVCGAWSVVGSIGVSLPFYLHAMAERGCNSMFRASCRRSGADSATERNNGIP
jgi:hypothetical protein